MSLIFITPNEKRWYDLEDLPNEEWLDIYGYSGLYQISNYSRIKSLSKYKNRTIIIMRPYRDKMGRYIIKLYKDTKPKSFYVHRLVGLHFIENPGNKPEINHKTPVTVDLCDNRFTELEWCTSSENSQYTVDCGNNYCPTLGLFGDDNPRSKSIVQLTKDGLFIKRWANAREIDRELFIDFRYVSRCCRHKCKTAKGYMFIFEEEYYDKYMGDIK